MKFIRSYAVAVEFLARIGIFIASVCVGFMMLSTVADMLARYIYNKPITGVVELNEILMAVMVFFCLAWTQVKKGHISVELLYDKLPVKVRRGLTVLTTILALIIFIAFTYESFLSAYDSFITDEFRQGAVQFLLWPGKTTLFLGGLILCLQFIREILEEIFLNVSAGKDDKVIL